MSYKNTVKNGKLLFEITSGQFKGVEYLYEKLSLNGNLSYKILSGKKRIDDTNKILFESEIRDILKEKLSKLN